MRRLLIRLERDLHDALADEATVRGVSKAALVRQFLRERLAGALPGRDPLGILVGDIDKDAGDIDVTIYDR